MAASRKGKVEMIEMGESMGGMVEWAGVHRLRVDGSKIIMTCLLHSDVERYLWTG
jgi:hypothetical protein